MIERNGDLGRKRCLISVKYGHGCTAENKDSLWMSHDIRERGYGS